MRFTLAVILILMAHSASASMTNARFALHRKDQFIRNKAIPNLCDNPATPTHEPNYSPNYTGTPCSQYTVTGPLYASTVYVVIANAGPEGVGAASFGIDYSGRAGQGTGIAPEYVSWTSCADGLMFPSAGSYGDFPNPGGGVRITWNTPTSCANEVIGSYGVHAVVGCLYVYAYAPGDVLKVTPNNNVQGGPELLVASCAGVTTNLLPLYPGDRVEDIFAKVGFGAQRASAFNPCGGLPSAIGRWGFDEAASGNGDGIAYDTSPLGQHHGAISGATYVPGIFGFGALHFDGGNDFVGIAAAGSPLQLVNSDYTISWWARPDDLSGMQTLLEMDDALDHSGGYAALVQGAYLKLAHDNGLDNTVSLPRIVTGSWQHFAMVYSKEDGKRYLYLNGAPTDTVPVAGGGLTADGDDQLYFGSHEGMTQFYRGALDDVRIYDRALPPDLIRLLLGPSVIRASANDHSTQVRVVFNMAVGAGATDPVNYSVFPAASPDNLIPVLGASVLDTIVTLDIGLPLTLPTSYSLVVNNVESVGGTTIARGSTAPIQIADVDPPTLLFGSGFVGVDTVRVIFSEPVGAGGNVPANYSIHPLGRPDDVIPVNSASPEGATVVLVLNSPLSGGFNYTLEVSNVEDLHGNIILPNSRISVMPAVPLVGDFVADRKLTKGYPGPRYQILGDVHIASGATWTLEPGVVVSFTPNQDAANLGDYLAQAEILCEGQIIAAGTSQDSIVFQSGGQAGDWGQIKFMTSGQGLFAYCAFRDAHSAIVTLPGTNANVTHSLIQWNSLDALVNSGTMTISDCSITRAGQRGVFATQGRLSVVRTAVNQTGMEAIRQEGGSGNLDFLTIDAVGGFGTMGPKYDGIFSANSATPIRWTSVSRCGADGIAISGQSARGVVTGNKVTNAGGAGIHLIGSAQDTVQFCDLTDCGSSGIFLENPGPGEHVEHCLVVRAQDGIKSQGGTDLSVQYSTIVSCRGSGLFHHETGAGMQLSVRNTILVSNQGWGIRDEANSTDDDIRFVDSWNNIAGQYSGTACDSICLASNPLFANAAAGDYRLISTSPLRVFGEGATQMGRYGPDPADVVGIEDGTLTELRLPLSNSPNPFARSTTIAFSAEGAGDGDIEVFSVTGRMVRKETVRVFAGVNQIAFQRTDMASGLYFYRVSWPGHRLTAKMILVP